MQSYFTWAKHKIITLWAIFDRGEQKWSVGEHSETYRDITFDLRDVHCVSPFLELCAGNPAVRLQLSTHTFTWWPRVREQVTRPAGAHSWKPRDLDYIGGMGRPSQKNPSEQSQTLFQFLKLRLHIAKPNL